MADPPTASAMYRVLNTVELLEQILLALPPKRVLVYQRVSKTFESTIASSPQLQQALWLKPSPQTSHAANEPQTNPLFSHWRRELTITYFQNVGLIVTIRPSGVQHLKEGATCGKMLLWDQCQSETQLSVTIQDISDHILERRLTIKVGELALDKPPTVSELVEIAWNHEKAYDYTVDDYWVDVDGDDW